MFNIFSLLSLSVAWIFILLCVGCSGKRQWEYEPLSVVTTTSDESLFKLELHVHLMGRDGYVCSGSLVNNVILDESAMLEATCYHSSSGSADDYTLLPWSVPKQSYKKFVNAFYKNMVYKNLKECSDLPDPDNVYPFQKGTYTFDKCNVTGDGMPELLPEGYYKVAFLISGPFEAGFTSIAKVTTKIDLFG